MAWAVTSSMGLRALDGLGDPSGTTPLAAAAEEEVATAAAVVAAVVAAVAAATAAAVAAEAAALTGESPEGAKRLGGAPPVTAAPLGRGAATSGSFLG